MKIENDKRKGWGKGRGEENGNKKKTREDRRWEERGMIKMRYWERRKNIGKCKRN